MLGTSSSGPRYPPDNHDSTASTSLMNGENGEVEERSEKDQFRLNMDESSSGKTSFGIATNAGSGQLIDQVASHPALPVACYCLASILMTVVNKASLMRACLHKADISVKFVLSGSQFTMNFLLLTIQSVVCVSCVVIAKHMRVSPSSCCQITLMRFLAAHFP